MKIYKTSQIAEMIGVHPNTIRFYESMQLLPEIPRAENGYRMYNSKHLEQLRLLRTAFRAEIISDRLRQEVYGIVKLAATGNIVQAYCDTQNYLEHLREEKRRAEEAIQITVDILEATVKTEENMVFHKRYEVAKLLNVTTDVLRNWERNGLILVPENLRGRRMYGYQEINRLKIICTLRNAHYSTMSILRMLNRLDQGDRNIRKVIDTPGIEEDIISAADRYITALNLAEQDALEMLSILDAMNCVIGN